jgi:hypothetical protein
VLTALAQAWAQEYSMCSEKRHRSNIVSENTGMNTLCIHMQHDAGAAVGAQGPAQTFHCMYATPQGCGGHWYCTPRSIQPGEGSCDC